MRSLTNYKYDNNGYFNSLQANVTEPVFIGESFVINRGIHLDSVFNKLKLYEYKQIHGTSHYINENFANVSFNIDEQFAIRDLFINIGESYAQQLCNEFCDEYLISEALSWKDIKNGTKKFVDNISDTAKEYKDKFNDKLEELKTRLKDVYSFIKEVTSKAIKSAKELVKKFLDLMDKLKCGLNELFENFGANLEKIEEDIKNALTEALNNKSKRPSENIYENLGKQLASEQQVYEFLGFGKKKKEEQNNKKKDEYEEAETAKSRSEDKEEGIIVRILKQIALSVIVLTVVPALATCIWGGPVGIIVATIAKAFMSGYAVWKLVRNIIDTVHSDEWKKKGKLGKCITILVWVLMFGLTVWGTSAAFKDAKTIVTAFQENTVSQLVPDQAVQNVAKCINNIYKWITGNDTAGYADMMKVVNGQLVQLETVTTTEVKPGGKMGQDAEEIAKEFSAKKFTSSKGGAWDKFLTPKGIDISNIPDKSLCQVVLDGSKNAEHAKKLIEFFTKNGWSGNVSDGFNAGLNNLNDLAGSIFTLDNVPVELLKKAAEEGIQLGHNGLYSIVSASTAAITSTVTSTVTHVLNAITGTFAPVIAMPKVLKKTPVGRFRVRMGSSRTGKYDTYIVDSEKTIKTMTFGEILNKYNKEGEEFNSKAITKMAKQINEQHKALQDAKKYLEEKDNLSKDEKKKLKELDAHLNKMGDGVDKYECIVFFSEEVIEASKEENNNEVKEGLFSKKKKEEPQKVEYKPIMFFNSLTLQCCDLTDQRAAKKEGSKGKGPRKNPIPMKGLFSSYEFLPIDNGSSDKTIKNFICNIIIASITSALSMAIDQPCIKEMRKYVENPNSKQKGEREDFGEFTNKEITEIMNDTKAIYKYLGGEYKKRHTTVEKENTEEEKERKKRAQEEWKNEIENDEEIKEYIKNSKTLKKHLVDKDGKVKEGEIEKLTNVLLRIEHNYGKDSEKESIWKSIKDLFTGNKKDDISKYDAEEIKKLAFKLASKHNKNLKKRKKKIEDNQNESYIGEYYDICDRIYMIESNMYMFNEELEEYLFGNESILEKSINDEFEYYEEF